MECEHDDRRVAGALDHDATLAHLRRLLGIDLGQRARRTRQRSKAPFDRRASSLGIEIADDERGRVIGMIVRVVEFAQPFGRNAFDVRAPADRRMVVGVLAKRRRDQRRGEDAHRIVVVALQLVANDGHLRAPVDLGDRGVPHPVCFEFDREIEIAGGNALEIVGAVEPGRCVLGRADLVHDVGERAATLPVVGGRPFEQHVLEQMRGARVADGFVTGSDMIEDQERGDRRRRLRHEDDLQPVL